MRGLIASLALCLSLTATPGASAWGNDEALNAARGVMDDFMTTFNARDEAAWAATFNYPHVRFASGQVMISPDAKAVTDRMDFATFAASTTWHHSAWDEIEALDAGSKKVHFKVTFTRYTAENEKIATYDSLYVVTLVEGHWGIQARSSFAP